MITLSARNTPLDKYDTAMELDSHGITDSMTAEQATDMLIQDIELLFEMMAQQRVDKPWLFNINE